MSNLPHLPRQTTDRGKGWCVLLETVEFAQPTARAAFQQPVNDEILAKCEWCTGDISSTAGCPPAKQNNLFQGHYNGTRIAYGRAGEGTHCSPGVPDEHHYFLQPPAQKLSTVECCHSTESYSTHCVWWSPVWWFSGISLQLPLILRFLLNSCNGPLS